MDMISKVASATMAGRSIPGCPWTFANDMRKMVNNKEFSNAKFIVGSSRVQIFGNSCILSARSQVFKAMFENEDGLHTACLENPIILPDIAPETFHCLLEFLYTNCCTLHEENVIDVLASAAEYSLDELQQICGEFIANTLSISTACAAMQVSVMYNLLNLKETVLAYIEKNAHEVFKTEAFHELSEEAFSVLLSSDNLNIDELDLIALVREWATVNSIGLNKPIQELTKNIVQHLRLLLLSPDELTIVEAENEKDILIPIKMISDAWKYHALKSSSAVGPSTAVRPRSGTKGRTSQRKSSSSTK
ncbi:BTB/POZ domain-containing protein 19-like [Dendronephthya gigantea]|uniref:BTB/POZ domain-containing protein 19-like n=1 Tax=Dendronephthya gigantea TaxID=151771 RepID=UPI00106D373F|nr:BTB/POZ domain-containing protein 19-like [Dendronephthya gigantea]XP_028404747.1 BTB/POZ domain-containing protein 19-like [Dendronephthya gigantea]